MDITSDLVISRGNLKQNQLKGKTAIVTGAGGGIGFEAARALVWLGANVIIAEINKKIGLEAQSRIETEFGRGKVLFVQTDVGNESSIKRLINQTKKKWQKIDIVINNATVATIGAVDKAGIDKWDLSYQVNLRGPVLLAGYCLSEMVKRNEGIMVFVSSSGAAPFMGPYEVLKTAQVELSNTLASELEDSGVKVFTIGPGLVKTATADKAIKELAPLYGKTVEEFYKLNENAYISAEEAGAGFAAAIAMADKYEGQEVGSIQALMDAGIVVLDKKQNIPIGQNQDLSPLVKEVRKTFEEQFEGWKQRNIFERQWVARDFKKHVGVAPEQVLFDLRQLEKVVAGEDEKCNFGSREAKKLAAYYKHQIDLLKGYEKDQAKVKEYTETMLGWIEKAEKLSEMLS